MLLNGSDPVATAAEVATIINQIVGGKKSLVGPRPWHEGETECMNATGQASPVGAVIQNQDVSDHSHFENCFGCE